MATFHRAPDQWTSVHDQFGNFRYWLNRETQERRYMNNPPRQPLVLPPMAFEGALHINPAIDPRLHFVARPPAEGFPPQLGWIDEFHSPALEVREPTVGRGWAPPVMGDIGRFPFPPNNFTRPLPRPSPRRRSSPKPSTKEADQWFLQSNNKGEKYYLNTTTWEWQIETPDCLKKYTTR